MGQRWVYIVIAAVASSQENDERQRKRKENIDKRRSNKMAHAKRKKNKMVIRAQTKEGIDDDQTDGLS